MHMLAVGAILGFSLVWDGKNGVVWSQPIATFPYVKGFLPIVISWFASPTFAGIIAAVLFLLNRHLVLRRPNSVQLAFWVLPILVGLTVFINLFFVLYKVRKPIHSYWRGRLLYADLNGPRRGFKQVGLFEAQVYTGGVL